MTNIVVLSCTDIKRQKLYRFDYYFATEFVKSISNATQTAYCYNISNVNTQQFSDNNTNEQFKNRRPKLHKI